MPTREESPTYAEVSRRANAWLFASGQDWAGIPIPLPGLRLTVESKHPKAEMLADLQDAVDSDLPTATGLMVDPDVQFVNEWYSTRERCTVLVVRENGRPKAYRVEHWLGRRANILLHTLQAATAWSLETEAAALDRLETLIKPHLFEAYAMTGAFLETSKRSGLVYVFRRARPTLVVSHHECPSGRFLCALCLHPIAYYEESFAGGMCPTDDVIAHLLLMRADEHLFWRRANQHPVDRAEAGL